MVHIGVYTRPCPRNTNLRVGEVASWKSSPAILGLLDPQPPNLNLKHWFWDWTGEVAEGARTTVAETDNPQEKTHIVGRGNWFLGCSLTSAHTLKK